VLSTLHTILVLAFIGVTALLLSLTVLQRFRVRRVRMTWRCARRISLPIWPLLFVGLVAVFLVYAQNVYPVVNIFVFAGYLLGGLLWYIAGVLATTTIVTDYGIIPEIGKSGDTVAWGQISDYFEAKERHRTIFVFLYQDILGTQRRLELVVPSLESDRFRALLHSKLGTRIDYRTEYPVGRTELEN
jgi:hypothetical protein